MSLSVASIAGLSVLGTIILSLILIVIIIIIICTIKKCTLNIRNCWQTISNNQSDKNREEFLNILKAKQFIDTIKDQSILRNSVLSTIPNETSSKKIIVLNATIRIQRFYRAYRNRKHFKLYLDNNRNLSKIIDNKNISSNVTLSMLLFYDVMYYGSSVVDQCFGVEILKKSARKLMINSMNNKKKARIHITPKGLHNLPSERLLLF